MHNTDRMLMFAIQTLFSSLPLLIGCIACFLLLKAMHGRYILLPAPLFIRGYGYVNVTPILVNIGVPFVLLTALYLSCDLHICLVACKEDPGKCNCTFFAEYGHM